MELLFLLILILSMVVALGAGFPVAFALPGSAILSIGLAALCGALFAGDTAAYFAHGDPYQWLYAGVTNFRGIYWEAERDTLIAIPLFIFMGIMLERSKIAEDLLETMGKLFGPVPGGIGISVVVVGALLAASTGIVGATVIAMGLISLPVMLRAKYSHALATGTISASGTLGQIIPPSIVLIILADQLSNATDQAGALRTHYYKRGTGESVLPSEFGLTSTSAGDMFLGAFLPGLVLVGLYILYILTVALIRPKMAPPAPNESGFDRAFFGRVLLVLVPPLALIFAVLGSIIAGIATVNQAGAIGAVGAMIMASYRLRQGENRAFWPAIIALAAVAAIIVVTNLHPVNVKSIQSDADVWALVAAVIASLALLFAVGWAAWRVHKLDNTLEGVMIETAKTTALVFIILLGAAMLTAAFRAFGGEELVRDFLLGLPGGFYAKFIVVMAVIFVLGFFLDFIEIAVVVVPIIAPILLADPSANVTAVWLGVMIGVNMQTSFLTPPFGFALFYLRGVAPAIVKTISIYKGVVPFILLQLLGLAIVGFFPPLVNYLPARVYLTSETAPPPSNPRLQACVEELLFTTYASRGDELKAAIAEARNIDLSDLSKKYKRDLGEALAAAGTTFEKVAAVQAADAALTAYIPEYRPLHNEHSDLLVRIDVIERRLKRLDRELKALKFDASATDEDRAEIADEMARLNDELEAERQKTPAGWDQARARYVELEKTEKKARRTYRRTVDDAYEPIPIVLKVIAGADDLAALEEPVAALREGVENGDAKDMQATIKALESRIGAVAGASSVKSALSKVRRSLKKKPDDRPRALKALDKTLAKLTADVAWRRKAADSVAPGLQRYDAAIRDTIGLRQQPRLSKEQASEVAVCQSRHRDISLSF